MNALRLLAFCALAAALASCAPRPQTPAAPAPTTAVPAPVATEAPSGAYTTDPAHSTLIFRVDHLGFSRFTGRFTKFNAKLDLDVKTPEASKLEATIDPASLALDNPPKGFLDELKGPEWLAAKKFPQMVFRSTKIERTGADTAKIRGDFSFRGVTAPVTLEAKFNGGYPGMSLDPNARIGFSAHGSLNRSAFGLSIGVPAPGSTMGVGDAVEIIIETEMTGPAFKG